MPLFIIGPPGANISSTHKFTKDEFSYHKLITARAHAELLSKESPFASGAATSLNISQETIHNIRAAAQCVNRYEAAGETVVLADEFFCLTLGHWLPHLTTPPAIHFLTQDPYTCAKHLQNKWNAPQAMCYALWEKFVCEGLASCRTLSTTLVNPEERVYNPEHRQNNTEEGFTSFSSYKPEYSSPCTHNGLTKNQWQLWEKLSKHIMPDRCMLRVPDQTQELLLYYMATIIQNQGLPKNFPEQCDENCLQLKIIKQRLHAIEHSLTWRLARKVFGAYDKAHSIFIRLKETHSYFCQNELAYAKWVKQYDTLNDDDRQTIRQAAQGITAPITISVLLPVYNTKEHLLRQCIESVLTQLYPNFELCIADDASNEPHVRKVIEKYARHDTRIKVVFRESNGHISRATNSALELASGKYIALLDHDDVLPEHALFMVALELQQHPDADIIYSDEDKIDERNNRFAPYFKPDFNKNLLHSQNCISHLGVYRTDLVRNVGGFRHEMKGSQDWDLCLRVVEQTEPSKIRHIPMVLYHWRAIKGSTALDAGEKSYAVESGRRAVLDHFSRTNMQAEVDLGHGGYLRVRHALPNPPPHVSVVMLTTGRRLDVLKTCLYGILLETNYPAFDLTIVPNNVANSELEPFLETLKQDSRVRLAPYGGEFNFSAIHNVVVPKTSGEILAFCNDDLAVLERGWLREMVSHAVKPDVGAVGARLLYDDDTVQHAGVLLGVMGVAGHAHLGVSRNDGGYFGRALLTQEMSAVTAACMVLRRRVFEEVKGFDERFAVAFNDIDLCLRIREAGYRIIYTPYAELRHKESLTRGKDTDPSSESRFIREIDLMQRLWQGKLLSDPAYNPNLSLQNGLFELAFPPRFSPPWRRKSSHEPS